MKEHLPLMRRAGMGAVWLGVEDISGTLVEKGQSGDHTQEAFDALRLSGILPVPMLMHYDEQPLYSRRGSHGLLNQLRLLRKAGAVWMQVLMLIPGPARNCTKKRMPPGWPFRASTACASSRG